MGNLKDYATSTVLTPPSPATSGTTIVVQSGHGTRFPAVPFMVTVHPPAEFPTLDNAEKLEVTAKTDDTFTVLRAQGDTTAKSIEAGWRISNSVFDADLLEKASFASGWDKITVNTAAPSTPTTGDLWVDTDDGGISTTDVSAILAAIYPVGSIYISGSSSMPSLISSIGTWVRLKGRVIVGHDETQAEFDTVNETGGHKLTQAHTHTRGTMNITGEGIRPGWNDSSGGGIMMYAQGSSTSALYTSRPSSDGYWWAGISASGGAGVNTQYHTRINFDASRSWSGATSSYGGGNAQNLQPYKVKYMWERTA